MADRSSFGVAGALFALVAGAAAAALGVRRDRAIRREAREFTQAREIAWYENQGLPVPKHLVGRLPGARVRHT
jgi:hypothetical protein